MTYKAIVNQNATTVEILLYGLIGKWMDIDVDRLVLEIESLRKQGVSNITFYVNSDGGEVNQGQALFNYLQRSNLNVTWVVDGIAASMMAMLLTNPKHTVIANKYSKFMFHRLCGMVSGNADEVRNYADTMEKFEADLIKMFAERTKMDEKKVKKEYFNNNDTWLSAEEALKIGIVNEIRSGNSDLGEPKNLGTPREVYAYYSDKLINTHKPKIEIEMKKIAALLNLNENSSEEAIATAVQGILDKNKQSASDISKRDNEITELKNQVAEQKKAKIKAMVDKAIEARKISEDMRQEYTDMAGENFERTEKVLNSMAGVDPIVAQLGKTTVPDTEKDWTWDDYHKKGKCENLKATNLPRFKDLYKAKFNKEYKD